MKSNMGNALLNIIRSFFPNKGQAKSHSEQAADRFDKWAGSYGGDRISSWFSHYQSEALSRLTLDRRHGFLDVGCGTGWAVRRASDVLGSGKACGIDISPKMIENAQKLSKVATCLNTEFLVADSEAIPYPEDAFEAVICTFSIHHYKSPKKALSEIRRVLHPDGRVVILDAARDVSPAIWLQDRGRRYLEKSHVKYYTTKEMAALVCEAGLKIRGDISTVHKIFDHKKVFTGLMVVECSK